MPFHLASRYKRARQRRSENTSSASLNTAASAGGLESDFAHTSSEQSSIVSGMDDSFVLSSSSEYALSNTLDADSGRRLQALQTSMRNPSLSSAVRSILETAYREFDKQSCRCSELLPPYTADSRPPYEN